MLDRAAARNGPRLSLCAAERTTYAGDCTSVRCHKQKARLRRTARLIDRHASARQLPALAAHRVDNLVNSVDHELGLVEIDVVAALSYLDMLGRSDAASRS
jgi:hypothetical protein